jgi:hypothetical protein
LHYSGSHHFRRITSNDNPPINIAKNAGAGLYYCALAYRHARRHKNVCGNPAAFTYYNWRRYQGHISISVVVARRA